MLPQVCTLSLQPESQLLSICHVTSCKIILSLLVLAICLFVSVSIYNVKHLDHLPSTSVSLFFPSFLSFPFFSSRSPFNTQQPCSTIVSLLVQLLMLLISTLVYEEELYVLPFADHTSSDLPADSNSIIVSTLILKQAA